MGKGKQAIPARGSKRRRVDAPSSSTSAALGNGGGRHGSPEDVTSNKHSVLHEPPPLQASSQFIEAQGEPPTVGVKWNFNLEESTTLKLPPVPVGWVIFESLPSEEERATLPEAVLMTMMRCIQLHRVMVG